MNKFLSMPILGLLLLIMAACQPAGKPESEIFTVVRNNNVDRLGQYLAEGGDPNAMNEDGDSLLYVASGARGGVEAASLLILSGADPDLISREGRTALHTAAGWCNGDVVEVLLNANASVDIKNAEGKLAIDVVCAQPQNRRDPVLALLLAARAN